MTILDSEGLREMSSLDSEKTHACYAPSIVSNVFFFFFFVIFFNQGNLQGRYCLHLID